jgi:hypothetical protein
MIFGPFRQKSSFNPEGLKGCYSRMSGTRANGLWVSLFVPAQNSLTMVPGRAHGELSPLMKNYRAYAVWPNGNFEGYEALICVDDDEAIGRARRLADKSAIELWSGERFITRLEHKSR